MSEAELLPWHDRRDTYVERFLGLSLVEVHETGFAAEQSVELVDRRLRAEVLHWIDADDIPIPIPREEDQFVEMILVRMGLQPERNAVQRNVLAHRCGEQIRPEIDQQLVVDEQRGAKPVRSATSEAGGIAVVAVAERVGVAFGRGGSQEVHDH